MNVEQFGAASSQNEAAKWEGMERAYKCERDDAGKSGAASSVLLCYSVIYTQIPNPDLSVFPLVLGSTYLQGQRGWCMLCTLTCLGQQLKFARGNCSVPVALSLLKSSSIFLFPTTNPKDQSEIPVCKGLAIQKLFQ